MISTKLILAALAALVFLAQPLSAQVSSRSGDSRVKTILTRLDLPFTMTTAGNFQIEFLAGGGRTQVVTINSGTQIYGTLEIREVSSYAFKSRNSLTSSIANDLLLLNSVQKLGAWRALRGSGYVYGVFAVQLSADADSETLMSVLSNVVYTADGIESDVTGGGDEY